MRIPKAIKHQINFYYANREFGFELHDKDKCTRLVFEQCKKYGYGYCRIAGTFILFKDGKRKEISEPQLT
jgi:hypothetical protein